MRLNKQKFFLNHSDSANRFPLNSQHRSVDYRLLMTVITLIIFGVIMVYDASVVHALKDFGDSYYYIRQQLIWVVLGVIAAVFLYNFDYHNFKKYSVFLTGVSLVLLVAVFIPGLGVSGGGAHRWLNFGFFTLQPAEIIKLTGIMYLATIFEKKARLGPFLGLVIAVTFITAVLQRDLGSSIVFVAVSALMYFASGAPLWHFLAMIPPAVIAFAALVLTSSYRSKRVLAFLDPFSDTQGFTYHISQILIALGSGGFWGLGLGHSRQKFEYIPEVTTDSIFAIVGEEVGFIGSLVVISLFAILIIRGLRIASNCNDNFGKLLAFGITCWLGVQAIINLSSMVALLPLTGVPLPFISYGGSALVVNMAAIGILLNISKQNTQKL